MADPSGQDPVAPRRERWLIGLLATWSLMVSLYTFWLEHSNTARLAEMKKELAVLQERAQADVEKRESLNKMISETKQIQQQALASHEVLKKEEARRKAALESLRNNLQASQTTVEALRRQLAAANERLQKQEQELRTSKETIEDLRSRLKEP